MKYHLFLLVDGSGSILEVTKGSPQKKWNSFQGEMSHAFPPKKIWRLIPLKQPRYEFLLGVGCFQIFFECSPRKLGKMNPIWQSYFSTGLVQPPTSYESALGAHHGTYCSVQTPTSSPWPVPVAPLALAAASVAQRWMRRKVGWTAPGGRWLWVEGSKWCSN